MKSTAFVFVAFAILSTPLVSACTSARASPKDVEERGQTRSASIEAYEARKEGFAPMDVAASTDAATVCAEGGLIPWQRMADVDLCTSTCTSDVECASGERCRVLFFDGIDYDPRGEGLFADDMPELFEEHAEQRALLDDVVLDEAPVCEGECSGALGLPIEAVAPIAVCDPLVALAELE